MARRCIFVTLATVLGCGGASPGGPPETETETIIDTAPGKSNEKGSSTYGPPRSEDGDLVPPVPPVPPIPPMHGTRTPVTCTAAGPSLDPNGNPAPNANCGGGSRCAVCRHTGCYVCPSSSVSGCVTQEACGPCTRISTASSACFGCTDASCWSCPTYELTTACTSSGACAQCSRF